MHTGLNTQIGLKPQPGQPTYMRRPAMIDQLPLHLKTQLSNWTRTDLPLLFEIPTHRLAP